MRTLVLINAAGGTIRREGGVEAARQRLQVAFAAHAGVTAELRFAMGDELARHASEALGHGRRGDLDAVIVGGGDGSVGTVAGVLAGTDMPLGILPLGTLNHFAKDLGVPTDLAGAVATIALRHQRKVDVAEVNGRVFVNNSSVGLYPYMVLQRERRAKSTGWDKLLFTPIAVIRALRRFPRRRLAIRAAGLDEACRTPCLFIGNNQYGTDLLQLGRRQRLDAGELCVYLAHPRSRLGLLWLALLATLGRLDAARDLHMVPAETVEVVSRASRLLVALDGEVTRLRPPLEYRVRAGALRVLVPPPMRS